MEKFIIHGNTKLHGEVEISGAKNSALPLISAAVLINGVTTLENVPNISDIQIMCEILNHIGVNTSFVGKNTLQIDARNIATSTAPLELTGKMRASYYLIGSLLGREKECTVGIPGGCNIGQRPIDQHIKAFEQLGADVQVACGKVIAKATKLKLSPLKFPSMGK